MIYFDYNATAPLRPEVKEAMQQAMEVCGNPSSTHSFGRSARKIVDGAREKVAASVGIKPVQVIFTSGGTEANNWALQALTTGDKAVAGSVYCSAVEHDAVLNAPAKPIPLPVDENGILDLGVLENWLKRDADRGEKALVSVMWANNETGVLQPVEEIAALCKAYGAYVHTDAVQAWGKVPVTLGGRDMMTIAPHKVGGPKGIGALIVREDLPLTPMMTGGGHERSRRAGTENLVNIAGFGAAAGLMNTMLAESVKIEALRTAIESGIDARIYGKDVPRLPNTTCVDVTPVTGETKLIELDLKGVAVSSGSACSSGKVKPSHVLKAMGASDEAATSAIRISLGFASTEDEVRDFLKKFA